MDWKSSIVATAAGAAAAALFGFLAFHFLTSRQSPAMGDTLFLLVPVVAGFSIALVARRWDSITAAGLLSVAATLVLLISLGREGGLCAILAFPIIILGLVIGILIGVLTRKLISVCVKSPTTPTGMLLLMGPLLIVVNERIETPMLRCPRVEVVETSVTVNDSPERVWPNIVSIDNLKASKPLLMYIGLPVPQRCTIQGQGTGAKRTCFFNVGYIEETVTDWNPPSYMGLSIDRTHMPGRHWLGFESAEYRLEPVGTKTLLTRRTTVASYLRPSWYWRNLERLGVESEHSYILRDIVLKAPH